MPVDTNTQMIAKLTAGMENITRAVELLRDDLKASGKQSTDILVRMQSMDGDIKQLAGDVEDLLHIVRDGNSQPALIARVLRLETQQTAHHNDIEDIKKKYDTVVTSKMLTRGQIIIGVIGMVTTTTVALIAALIQVFKK